MVKTSFFFVSFFVFTNFLFGEKVEEFTVHENIMGSDFYITITHTNKEQAHQLLEEAVGLAEETEQQISSWQTASETTLINANAGIKPVKVSADLFYLIKRSIYISTLTKGVFDITYASLDNYWYFHKEMTSFPTAKDIEYAKALIDYKKLQLNELDTTVFLTQKGMRIGFGAIGKGYVANKIKTYLCVKGVKGGIVNAGGDISAWGKNHKDEYWTIAIADPTQKHETLAFLTVKDESIVTSGNYERFIMHNGEKYSHIINPVTGYPAKGVQSVTILSPDAELGDALATAVFVMGVEKGINFVNQLKDIEAIIVDQTNQIYTTEKINIFHEKSN